VLIQRTKILGTLMVHGARTKRLLLLFSYM